jgi:hypothetical protein
MPASSVRPNCHHAPEGPSPETKRLLDLETAASDAIAEILEAFDPPPKALGQGQGPCQGPHRKEVSAPVDDDERSTRHEHSVAFCERCGRVTYEMNRVDDNNGVNAL